MAKQKLNKRLPKGFDIWDKSGQRYRYRERYKGESITVYANTQQEAYEKAAEKRELIDNGIFGNEDRITLNAWYEHYTNERAGTIESSTSYTGDQQQYDYIKPYLGAKQLKNIKQADIIALRRTLQKDGRKGKDGKRLKALSTTTINKALRLLRRLLQNAVVGKIILKNPCDGVNDLKRKNTEPKAYDTIHRGLTKQMQELFLQYAEMIHSFYYLLFDFWFHTGLRVGEVSALTWSDIDFKTGVMHITKSLGRSGHSEYYVKDPKNEASIRDIPLNQHLKRVLKEHREIQNELGFSSFLVFTNSNGDRLMRGAINGAILTVVKNIQRDGIEFDKITSHAFRATFATRAVEKGVPVTTLQKLMGHAKITTTQQYYIHIHDVTLRDGMRLMDDEAEPAMIQKEDKRIVEA